MCAQMLTCPNRMIMINRSQVLAGKRRGSCEETLAAGEVGFGGQAGVFHSRGRITG